MQGSWEPNTTQRAEQTKRRNEQEKGRAGEANGGQSRTFTQIGQLHIRLAVQHALSAPQHDGHVTDTQRREWSDPFAAHRVFNVHVDWRMVCQVSKPAPHRRALRVRAWAWGSIGMGVGAGVDGLVDG